MKYEITVITTAVLLLVAGIATLMWYESISKTPHDVTYTIEKGDSLRYIAKDMQEKGAIQNAYAFMALAKIHGYANKIQAGEYFFSQHMPLHQVLEKIVKGDVVMHTLRIGEGWTFAEFSESIKQNDALTITLDWSEPATILQQLQLGAQLPEGLFYPDTYYFPRGYTDVAFLTHAYYRMQTFLHTEWQTRAQDLPYDSAYAALIAASIIEKETALDTERSEIAGVIVRRLEKKMPLQMDPTVVYGLGAHYDKPLTRADLKIDTPYNTYIHLGLPQSPIAIPSPASIIAALHPNKGNSLYFVANGDGSHTFSATLEEHNQAVKQYQETLNQKEK